MDNPFKYINHPPKEVPEELKDKVMRDIAMAKLIMEIATLFSYNLSHVIETVIKKRKSKNSK
ncbi:hypothetical protein [Siansivirga zeaxanthinifaciens]|uniref:Uncharacterized protein n=1 Tax=Siansivirga zeaxanthinifaciens CC-SAMT-1 TaxID=1454006 RepID=A0A0C5WFV1_9FLAO|nr:hypothetical protein [Siansivirga zeaxanthinifaciens]AJR04064.1 hypothetical protein AW14_10875 [Siansivirga zeaxanthinifaciens CC-SAMT-1]